MNTRILFFTMHRSGSTYAHQACVALCKAAGISYASPNPGADSKLNVRDAAAQPGFWAGRTGCVGPLRFFIDVPDIDHDRIILHLRDPRDVLTSMFYSYCYSHVGELPGNTGYRQDIAERGIDEFVLAMSTAATPPLIGDYGTGNHLWDLAGNVLNRYQQYVQHLLKRPNVQLVTYEQLVTDPQAWLHKIAPVFDPRHSSELEREVLEVLTRTDAGTREDVWSHKRQVLPGNHRQKLLPQTIARLNDLYAEPLRLLGYAS
jgi:hypothetical protein